MRRMSLLGRGLAFDVAVLMGGGYRSLFALDFDGVDDVVDFDNSIDNLFDGGATVGVWIYPRSDGELSEGRILDNLEAVTKGWSFGVFGESIGFVKIQVYAFFSTTPGNFHSQSAVVPLNQWSYLVFTYDSSDTSNTPIVYLNGATVTMVKSQTPAGSYVDDSGLTLKMGSNSNGIRTWDGLICDPFIANREWTSGEVALAYNNGSPIDLRASSLAPDLVLYAPMGIELTYPTIPDVAGSNNGTMTNMTSGDIVAGVNG